MEKDVKAVNPLGNYQAGFEAYQDGDTHNPHPHYSEQWSSWQRGWQTAQYGNMMNGNHSAL